MEAATLDQKTRIKGKNSRVVDGTIPRPACSWMVAG